MQKVKCNLCGSTEEKILFTTDCGNIVKCLNCGLVYRNPRLSEENEIDYYVHSIEPHYDAVNLSKEKIFREQLKVFRNQFPVTDYPSPKLLDVGCSDGFFLQLAKEQDFDVYGVEISKLAVSHARKRLGDNIFEGTLKEANFPEGYFDVITLWDVCEQFSDPLAELSEINRILSNSGLVLIRTRNINFHLPVYQMFHRSAHYLGIKPTVFHLYSFSAETIKTILEKSDFQKIKIYNSPMTIGDPYSGGKIFGKLGMQLLKYFVYLFCQIIYYSSRKKLILAPSMLILARK